MSPVDQREKLLALEAVATLGEQLATMRDIIKTASNPLPHLLCGTIGWEKGDNFRTNFSRLCGFDNF